MARHSQTRQKVYLKKYYEQHKQEILQSRRVPSASRKEKNEAVYVAHNWNWYSGVLLHNLTQLSAGTREDCETLCVQVGLCRLCQQNFGKNRSFSWKRKMREK